MNLTKLPDDVIQIIRQYYYNRKSYQKRALNDEFHSYLLESSDIGSIILCRIQGMPLLEDVSDTEDY